MALLAAVGACLASIAYAAPAWAGVALQGGGSSFAAPAMENWETTVSVAPYSLKLNYSSSSSGQGRFEFTNQTVDYGVSDTGYVAGSQGTTPPSFPFIFVPVTAAGVAFMYNIPGLTQTLDLTAYTACALLTGGITNWDDPAFHQNGANSGVTLPNLQIRPVTESDAAGTNYVAQEWCIHEQPALWAAFYHQQSTQEGGVTDGVPLSPNQPTSNWPGITPNGLDDANTPDVASDISQNPGAIGIVQLQYAVDKGFTHPNEGQAVASVLNASGDFTQPTPVDVASALAYATQLANGTHQLDFDGAGPNVYNPSTYSYLLTPTTGWSAAKGAVMSAFVNYVLTIGQTKAPSFGYASLGLSLERYGVDAVLADVPGAVAVTSAENADYACGDLTPAEVQAGQTTATCGVTQAAAPLPSANAGHAAATPVSSPTASGTSTGTSSSGAGVNSRSTAGTSGASGGATSSGASSVDPGVSISGASSPTTAYTGSNPGPLTVAGGLLFVTGWWFRRRLLRRIRPASKAPS